MRNYRCFGWRTPEELPIRLGPGRLFSITYVDLYSTPLPIRIAVFGEEWRAICPPLGINCTPTRVTASLITPARRSLQFGRRREKFSAFNMAQRNAEGKRTVRWTLRCSRLEA